MTNNQSDRYRIVGQELIYFARDLLTDASAFFFLLVSDASSIGRRWQILALVSINSRVSCWKLRNSANLSFCLAGRRRSRQRLREGFAVHFRGKPEIRADGSGSLACHSDPQCWNWNHIEDHQVPRSAEQWRSAAPLIRQGNM